MRTLLVTLTAAATTLAWAPTVSAQDVSIEIRGGLNRPISDFRDNGPQARGDAGFGGDVIFNVTPRFSLYGGYGWDRFGCEGCADGDWITSRGWEGGAKILFSEAGTPVAPWVRGGFVFNQAKVAQGSSEAISDRGTGFQGSFGLDIPLGQVIWFAPAVRYERFPAEFNAGPITLIDQTVSFLSLDFGLHIHPGAGH